MQQRLEWTQQDIVKFIRRRLADHPKPNHPDAKEGLARLVATLFDLTVEDARAIVAEQARGG